VQLTTTVLADQPDLAGPMWAMDTSWPEFMRHDPIGGLYYDNLEGRFAEYVLIGQDEAGEVVAVARSVPFVLDGEQLPDSGWDYAVRSGLLASLRAEQPNAISAIEIAIRPDLQGTGLSVQMLAAMRSNAARHGFTELLAPVRPNGKADPHEPMTSYAARVRDDGLPVDPWLRVHVRAGGRIDVVAPRSMVIPGTLAEWRDWTGLPFDRSGPVVVPEALAPVHCDIEHGVATYVEANVWVRHRTGAEPVSSGVRPQARPGRSRAPGGPRAGVSRTGRSVAAPRSRRRR
jgi:GNAT superfamily N-acetyltransferase